MAADLRSETKTMNIKVINGYLIVDGACKVSATYKLFTDEGIDIRMPQAKQPDRRPCDKCRQWHDPDLCCHPTDHPDQSAPANPWAFDPTPPLCPRCQTTFHMRANPASRSFRCTKCGTSWDENYLTGWNDGRKSLLPSPVKKPESQPFGRVATVGDVNQSIKRLLESMVRRLDALNQTVSSNYALHALAVELRLETEKWKAPTL